MNREVKAEEVINLAVGEFPPYCSEKMEGGGMVLKLVSEAFALSGIQVNYEFFPWLRAYEYARKGKDHRGQVWHGTVPWSYSMDRSRNFRFSASIVYDHVVFFYLKSKPFRWESLDDLKGKAVGLAIEAYYPVIENAQKDDWLTIERVGSYDVLMDRLKYKRVDVIPVSKRVGLYYLNQKQKLNGENYITYTPNHFEIRHFHLLLSKNIEGNEALVKKFNQGLKKLKRTNRYKEIIDSFGQYIGKH